MCSVPVMSDFPDFDVLAESIGETTIGFIGKENIRALAVEIDPRVHEAEVEIVLRHDDEDHRRAALRAFSDVAGIFWDEMVLSHNFVGQLRDRTRSVADSRRQFQFA